jgi:hypothetical protein
MSGLHFTVVDSSAKADGAVEERFAELRRKEVSR